MLATVRWLEVTATDDALELFDVFMAGELIGRAGRSSDKAKLKRAPGQARHAGVLSAAVQVLFEADTWGETVPLAVVWDAIETVVGSRAKLRTAMEAVQEFSPPPDAAPDGEWRAQVVLLVQLVDKIGAKAERKVEKELISEPRARSPVRRASCSASPRPRSTGRRARSGR